MSETVRTIHFGHPCQVCGMPATVVVGETAPRYYCATHNPILPSFSRDVPLGVVRTSDVWAAIERFRDHLRERGRESDEDVICELLDYLVGWCGPIPGRGVLRGRDSGRDKSSEGFGEDGEES